MTTDWGPLVIAVGIVIVNIIAELRTGKEVAEVKVKAASIEAKADVIVGHVNSRETEYLGRIAALEKEKVLLEQALAASEERAKMLAAATALKGRSA